jgi:hypothetical protein
MHKRFRPSSLPALAQCGKFESSPFSSDDADMGTLRHRSLNRYNTERTDDQWEGLDEESKESIRWASDYINLHTRAKPTWEKGIKIACGPQGDGINGTPDATDNIANVFDFKWRMRDYEAQMAAYSLGIMQEFWLPEIKTHLLFGEPRKPVVHSFTYQQAEEMVNTIIAEAEACETPTPCDYCNWCKHSATCYALVDRANTVAAGREDWELEQYHSSDITSPDEMAKALHLARALKKWCESVEYHAKEMAGETGLPGFKVQTKKGRRTVSDIGRACQLAGIAPDDFVKICSAPLGKIETLYFEGADFTSKAAACRELADKLAPVIERSKDSHSLVKEKEQTEK